jgi:CheY-like chemotaxis protein
MRALDPVTVLAVDDNALSLMTAMMIIVDAGYIAIAADNADAAMRALRKYPHIDALFTDVHMPGSMDGLALAKETHRLWPDIKILVVSGDANPTDAEIPDEARFLRKPYTSQQITRTLSELMGPLPRA